MVVKPGRALRAAGGPELAKLAAELLTGGRPVVGDIFAELGDVALEVHLVLLQPRDVELLARGAALELTREVFLVITDNPTAVRTPAIYRCEVVLELTW